MNYYLEAFKNYANFEGRARRSEYWYFVLFNLLAVLVLAGIGGAIASTTDSAAGFIPYGIYVLATLIPSLALVVRRLHDIDKSGWWILIGLIPFGGIVLLIFYCTDSVVGPNEYGPNPKGIGNAGEINQIGQE